MNFLKGDEIAVLKLVNELQSKPGGLCCFGTVRQDAKVTMLGVVPSVVHAWKNSDCTCGYGWSAIRCFSSTGEASSTDEYLWLMGRAQYKPVFKYCGGTEIGGGFVSGSLLQPQSLAAFSTPVVGCTLYILAEDGNPIVYYVLPMASLPRTTSNKVMRRVLWQQLVVYNRDAKL